MSWDNKQNGREYFYLSVRNGEKTKKLYFGRGMPAQMMADRVALFRAERKNQADSWRASATLWKQIDIFRSQWAAGVELLTSATLLATGFTRQCRHGWKRRQHANNKTNLRG